MQIGVRVLLVCVLLVLATGAAADTASAVRAAEQGDHQLAFWEWLLAAQRGDAAAQFRLGGLYYFGDGVPQDVGRAAVWYRAAAGQGHSGARFNLGLMYELGRGVAPDGAAAAAWYRLAAEQGNPHAQHNLAVLQRNGRGVPRDLVEAGRWYLRAAAQGHVPAQIKAALMYDDGEGVPVDVVQAYKWYTLAAAQLTGTEREEIALLIRALRPRLTGAQLAEAGRLVREWVPRPENRRETAVWPLELAHAREPVYPRRRAPAELQAGLGFVVDRAGHVLTSSDLVADCREVRALSPASAPQVAAVVARDTETDLALLRVTTHAAPAAFRAFAPGSGQPDAPASGFVPAGGGLVAGSVGPLAMPGEASRYLRVTPPVPVGSRGAPLLDEHGRVFGVVLGRAETARLARASDTLAGSASFALRARTAWSFLEAQGVRAEEPDPVPGRDAVPPLEERARDFTVILECRR